MHRGLKRAMTLYSDDSSELQRYGLKATINFCETITVIVIGKGKLPSVYWTTANAFWERVVYFKPETNQKGANTVGLKLRYVISVLFERFQRKEIEVI